MDNYRVEKQAMQRIMLADEDAEIGRAVRSRRLRARARPTARIARGSRRDLQRARYLRDAEDITGALDALYDRAAQE